MLDLVTTGNHRLVPKVAIRGPLDCLFPLDGQRAISKGPRSRLFYRRCNSISGADLHRNGNLRGGIPDKPALA